MTATIKAQPVYLANRKIGGSIKVQNVCLEPGVVYEITIKKLS
jgi:hypothetical protein